MSVFLILGTGHSSVLLGVGIVLRFPVNLHADCPMLRRAHRLKQSFVWILKQVTQDSFTHILFATDDHNEQCTALVHSQVLLICVAKEGGYIFIVRHDLPE